MITQDEMRDCIAIILACYLILCAAHAFERKEVNK
jgi:hypothetical protein